VAAGRVAVGLCCRSYPQSLSRPARQTSRRVDWIFFDPPPVFTGAPHADETLHLPSSGMRAAHIRSRMFLARVIPRCNTAWLFQRSCCFDDVLGPKFADAKKSIGEWWLPYLLWLLILLRGSPGQQCGFRRWIGFWRLWSGSVHPVVLWTASECCGTERISWLLNARQGSHPLNPDRVAASPRLAMFSALINALELFVAGP